MKLIEMTSSEKPLALGVKGNPKIPESDVARLELNGWQRAEVPKLKRKTEKKVKENG